MCSLDLFILIQLSLALIMALHDWVDLPPLTNLKALQEKHSVLERTVTSIINTLLVLIPAALCFHYRFKAMPFGARALIFTIYSLLTIGTIAAWWIPYLFGSSEKHKQGFSEYENTHHFLPAMGNNIIPNTLHVILHLHVWVAYLYSISLMFS